MNYDYMQCIHSFEIMIFFLCSILVSFLLPLLPEWHFEWAVHIEYEEKWMTETEEETVTIMHTQSPMLIETTRAPRGCTCSNHEWNLRQ